MYSFCILHSALWPKKLLWLCSAALLIVLLLHGCALAWRMRGDTGGDKVVHLMSPLTIRIPAHHPSGLNEAWRRSTAVWCSWCPGLAWQGFPVSGMLSQMGVTSTLPFFLSFIYLFFKSQYKKTSILIFDMKCQCFGSLAHEVILLYRSSRFLFVVQSFEMCHLNFSHRHFLHTFQVNEYSNHSSWHFPHDKKGRAHPSLLTFA